MGLPIPTALTSYSFSGLATCAISADVAYGGQFAGAQELRPAYPHRDVVPRRRWRRSDPVETAADKLSTLAWRVRARDHTRADDDPTIVRHLHDLAALEQQVASSPRFAELVYAAAPANVSRGGERTTPADPKAMFADMLRQLETDSLWAREYEEFRAGGIVRQAG